MNNYITKTSNLLLAIILMATGSNVFADLTTATSTVPHRNIPINQTSFKTVTWNVTAIAGTNQVGLITSPNITYHAGSANGPVLGILPNTISRTVSIAGTYPLIDNVRIPSSFVYRANKLGATRIVIRRTFNDGLGSTVGPIDATFDISGSNAAGFAINQVSVRFDNDQPQRVIKRLTVHKAYIKITYSGSGLLQGVWEIATPTTTIGQPVYRPLRVVRKQLVGTGITKVYSPRLPTRLQGIYLVRFRITDPASSIQNPLIRYFVYTGQKPLLSPVHVFLHQPGPSTTLNAKTVFSWSKVSKASALRLELYAIKQQSTLGNNLPVLGGNEKEQLQVNGKLITGKLLRGNDTETTLSSLTVARLKPGHWYLWRLVAFDIKGNIIGVSEPRKLQMPLK